MKLPDHIYNAVKTAFEGHASWHNARKPENTHLRGPGTNFPGLKGTNEAGSGEQFLRFHREMVRVFKWIVENTPGPIYAYTSWDKVPQWLENIFNSARPSYTQAAYSRIDQLVREGSADSLGNFIEATELAMADDGSNIHNTCHGTIGSCERQTFGATNPGLTDAHMDSFATAQHNEHFWGLHGWIDNIFAAWQESQGEVVDQSPLHPHESHHHHLMAGPIGSIEVMTREEEAEILKPIWE